MSRLGDPVIPYEHLSDLLQGLADFPPERIRMFPAPGTVTEADLLKEKRRSGRLCELIDRTLVEKPMGYYEARIAVVLAYFIEAFLETSDLGIVLPGDGLMRVEPGQVRLPDLSFFSWQHFADRVLPKEQILSRVPDLVVEVLSPSNTRGEMARKRREFFLGGTRLFWEIDPVKKTVRVYTNPEESRLLREKQTLEGVDVLPGFQLAIARLFQRAGRRAE